MIKAHFHLALGTNGDEAFLVLDLTTMSGIAAYQALTFGRKIQIADGPTSDRMQWNYEGGLAVVFTRE